MRPLLSLLLVVSVFAYEKIRIFSDPYSIINVKRDPHFDRISVTSDTKIGASCKTYGTSRIPLPEGLESIDFVLTDPKQNIGRYSFEAPFDGVYLSLTYDHQRPLTGLCDYFAQVLPCFNVKQCNSTSRNDFSFHNRCLFRVRH